MNMSRILQRIVLLACGLAGCWAQSNPKSNLRASAASALEHHKLAEAETITFSEVQADAFLDPLVCDADENLYLQTEATGFTGIRKLDLKGHQLAVFYPGSAPGIGPIDAVGSFSVSANGDLYELIFPHEPNRYVAAFDSSGKPKSKIKLDAGFSFTPSQIASLGSDYLLLAGMRPDGNPSVHPMRPFTGIFDSSGTLVKEVNLEDDGKIYDMAAAGDHRVVPVDKPPFFNNAVQHGKAISAPDGNAYMMRVLLPSVVYGISPAGAVVHRFTVDPGDADYIPMSMHVSGDRIAIQFRNPVTRDGRIIIVRTSGEVIASYDDPAVDGRSTFGPALACYLSNPDRFVFLTTNDSKLGLKIAKAQ